MKTDYETTRVEVITTSDGRVFRGDDIAAAARHHERKILAQNVLKKRGFSNTDNTVAIILITFDDLIKAFHTEGVLTEDFGQRDDF